MMFPRLVADLPQRGITVPFRWIAKLARATRAFALEDCEPQIAQIVCDKTAK
jgi:hypothetical protein